jgi:hypothetical protein
MTSICLSCNICHNFVDGIAYRTSCAHFFCPPCAKTSFQNDSFCPVCNCNLSNGDVVELTIGIPSVPLMDSLFQNALQNTSWEKIVNNIDRISLGVIELNKFITSQLFIEITNSARIQAQQLRDIQSQSNHLVLIIIFF